MSVSSGNIDKASSLLTHTGMDVRMGDAPGTLIKPLYHTLYLIPHPIVVYSSVTSQSNSHHVSNTVVVNEGFTLNRN